MNWHKVLQEIYSTLEMHGYGAIADQIRHKQLEGGTGGETFDIVLTELLYLKNERVKIYSIIKPQADSIIEFAKSLGYL